MLVFAVFVVVFITSSCVADPETMYGKKASSLIFICPYKSTLTMSVTWSITNSLFVLPISDGIYKLEFNPLYTRVSIVGNHTAVEYNLQLSDIRESDVSVYRCSVGLQLKEYKLELYAAPLAVNIQYITSENKVLGTESKSLTIRCASNGGNPPPLVTISVDNIVMSAAQSVQYTISTLERRHDRQTVTCQANSSALESPLVTNATLYLVLKPFSPVFDTEAPKTNDTQVLVVSCLSTGSRPAAAFYWKIGNESVTLCSNTKNDIDSSTETYTVTSTLTLSIDRTYNGRTILCGVTHQTLTGVLETRKSLSVYFAPNITVKSVTYDQNTGTRTVTCNAVGNPTTYTYYRWQHKSTYGVLIRELDGGQDGVLTLPNVSGENRYQDSGEYICTAGNGITDKDGRIQQFGSGIVEINARPVFTSDNKVTEYGQMNKDVDIHFYLYSIPKYSLIRWYKGTKLLSQSAKYIMSDTVAIVSDVFHGTTVQLDGYRLTLTIKDLKEADFNNSYELQLSNNFGEVEQHIFLQPIAAPQIPADFKAVRSTVSSITLQWNSGDNLNNDLAFYLEYRLLGDDIWNLKKITRTQTFGTLNYTILGLQDGSLYEVRMYTENTFNKSSPTEVLQIQTNEKLFPCSQAASQDIVGGVAGTLSSVIIVLVIVIIILFLMRKGMLFRKPPASTKRKTGSEAHNISFSKTNLEETDDHTYEQQTDSLNLASSRTYETLGMKEIPNVYSVLSNTGH